MSKSYKPISSKYISTTGIMHNHTLLSTFLDNLFPVGSVVIRADNTNPNTLYGGTWSKIASGRCLWGASSDSELNTTADSGLPNIMGEITFAQWNQSYGIYNFGVSGCFYKKETYPSGRLTAEDTYWGSGSASSSWFGINAAISSSIYGSADFVRPPLYRVYIWRRTA